jgi:hypothetical protein
MSGAVEISSTASLLLRHSAGTCAAGASEQSHLIAAGACTTSSMAARSSGIARGSSERERARPLATMADVFNLVLSPFPSSARRWDRGQGRSAEPARRRRTSRAALATGSICAYSGQADEFVGREVGLRHGRGDVMLLRLVKGRSCQRILVIPEARSKQT